MTLDFGGDARVRATDPNTEIARLSAMSSALAKMSARRQVAMLRELTRPLLADFGMPEAQLSLLNHDFNTTFKVVNGNEKFALRINMNSVKTHEGVLAEVQLVNFLADKGFPAPRPVPLKSGAFVGQVFIEPLGRAVDAVMYRWLPGSLVSEKPNSRKWFEAGRLMADLHKISKEWRPEAPGVLPRVDDPLMGSEYRLGSTSHLAITDELRELCTDVVQRTECFFDRTRLTGQPRPIHTDMHGHNLMSNRGKISVFDFDDAGMGFEIQDLANATYYMRDRPEFEQALFDGYSSSAELPSITEEEFEVLLASRSVMLLNDLLKTNNAELYEYIPEYAGKILWRLKNLKDTGRYTLAADVKH